MSKKKTYSGARILAALVFTLALLGAGIAQAQPVLETVMHGFTNNSDGENPISTPVVGKNDGALYGITFAGGTNTSRGIIWKINRDGSGYRILHSFFPNDTSGTASLLQPQPALIQGGDGLLYGTTPGVGFTGTDPTTQWGTVFKMTPDSGLFTVLHSFTASDSAPGSLVQGSDGALYGAGLNSIFKLNTDGNNYTVLHTFNASTDGSSPVGALIQGSDGALYGTSVGSGPNNHGTVFKLDTNNTFTVLHSFGSIPNDGQQPFCGLVQADNGALYGMTRIGGSNSLGTLFMLNPDGGGYTNLHHFGSPAGDGAHPVFGSLTKGLSGVLYGTTEMGGASNDGTIFKIGLDGNGYNVLYSFLGGQFDGANPYGGIAFGPVTENTGVFYGTAETGYASAELGTVFSMLVNPPVSITPVSNPTGTNGTVVFWPQWAFNYTLQMTTNLSSTNWVTVSNAAPVVGVQLTNTPPTAYFRLIHQ